MLVEELLDDFLEDLGSDDFQKFKWYLSLPILENCQPIPKSHLESANRTDTVNRMVDSYGQEMAVNIAVKILRKMRNNLAADNLERRYRERNTATPSSSSSSAVAPPVVPTNISASDGSTIIAPIITCGTTGTLNINVTRPQ